MIGIFLDVFDFIIRMEQFSGRISANHKKNTGQHYQISFDTITTCLIYLPTQITDRGI